MRHEAHGACAVCGGAIEGEHRHRVAEGSVAERDAVRRRLWLDFRMGSGTTRDSYFERLGRPQTVGTAIAAAGRIVGSRSRRGRRPEAPGCGLPAGHVGRWAHAFPTVDRWHSDSKVSRRARAAPCWKVLDHVRHAVDIAPVGAPPRNALLRAAERGPRADSSVGRGGRDADGGPRSGSDLRGPERGLGRQHGQRRGRAAHHAARRPRGEGERPADRLPARDRDRRDPRRQHGRPSSRRSRHRLRGGGGAPRRRCDRGRSGRRHARAGPAHLGRRGDIEHRDVDARRRRRIRRRVRPQGRRCADHGGRRSRCADRRRHGRARLLAGQRRRRHRGERQIRGNGDGARRDRDRRGHGGQRPPARAHRRNRARRQRGLQRSPPPSR